MKYKIVEKKTLKYMIKIKLNKKNENNDHKLLGICSTF